MVEVNGDVGLGLAQGVRCKLSKLVRSVLNAKSWDRGHDHLRELDAEGLGIGDFDVGPKIEAGHVGDVQGRGCRQ